MSGRESDTGGITPDTGAFRASEQDIDELQRPVRAGEDGPEGYTRHAARQGDTISMIAIGSGHFWETIWNDGENAELKDKRKNEEALLPRDVVFIPPLRKKQESGETEARHRFRRRGVPLELILVFVDHEQNPRSGHEYTILFDTGEERAGSRDGDEQLKEPLLPDVRSGEIRVTDPDTSGETVKTFELGEMDPVDTVAGIQKRLINLGYDCERIGDRFDSSTRHAIARFQEDQGLNPTGEACRKTRDKLVDMHNS
jgi:N-acetylmuramoyl-L-alanine amidase